MSQPAGGNWIRLGLKPTVRGQALLSWAFPDHVQLASSWQSRMAS